MFSYFSNSKSPLYSFLFTLPLFIVYEIGVFISSIDQTMVIRNGADVLLRQFFSYFGLNGFKWLGIIFLISYLITFLIHKRKLWEKQKKGKKRMKMIGKVEVPQEALLAVLQIESN